MNTPLIPLLRLLLLIFVWLATQSNVDAQELPTVYEYFGEGGLNSGLIAEGPEFKLNGKSLRIISGAIHYFRIHPSQWRDSLQKLRAAGANSIETYIPWNLHEPRMNEFDFGEGQNDFSEFMQLEKFIKMAQEEDLLVLLRPGPFICAEFEYGGFPSWLLRDPNMKLRGSYQPYLDRIGIYYTNLLQRLAPLQFLRGGPIIAIQLENEYANYWPISTTYLEYLENMYKSLGFESTLLYTSDNSPRGAVGSLPSLLKTANFREDPVMNLEALLAFQPDKPPMVMEFWTGWFDPWFATSHETWSPEAFATNLEIILGPQFNASVNFYVFHGGTNFGFTAGGIYLNNRYNAMVTSYDYDAPLTESGDYTEKYARIQELVERYAVPKLRRPNPPAQKEKTAYATLMPQFYLNFDAILNQVPSTSKFVLEDVTSMENLDMNGGSGQSYGYLVFSPLDTSAARNGSVFRAGVVKDFACLVVDGVVDRNSFASDQDHTLYWMHGEWDIVLNIDPQTGPHRIDLLVEEMARINVGSEDYLNDQRKGLPGAHVYLDGTEVKGFNVIALEFTSAWVKSLTNFQPVTDTTTLQAPIIVQSSFDIEGEPLATYIDLTDGWHKGIVFINGFNLGRYFKVGPQKRLFVPAAVLKTGQNTVTIFEQLEVGSEIKFDAFPDLG